MALPDAVSAVNQAIATVEGGSLQDTGVLDDIERLLDIIATHVERIRAATSDTSASSQLADALAATDRAVAAKDMARNKAAAVKEKPEEKPTIIKCKGFGVCNPVTLVQDPNGEWNQIDVKALDPEKLSWKKPWSKKKGGS
ncbi:hypothetical protein N0V88_004648 [Collariella sp. IMI 366227]|nr:hypothetical protein N0V88_004648 [Collariella sp. IMI 366227]